MHTLVLTIRAKRKTTRDGTEPDDELYRNQILNQLRLRILELEFDKYTIDLKWEK